MPKVLLTDKLVEGLPCPADKRRIEYCDTRLPGLYLEKRATSPGEGTFYLRYKDAGGKTCHQKIARTTDIDLAEARQRAKTLKAEIQLGRDPRTEAKQTKQALTWTEFFDQWYLPHAKQHLRSWGNLEEMHRLRIKDRFGHLRLDQITRHAVQQFHGELRESGLAPGTCDHHLKLIRQALNLAVEWSLLEKNPVSRVKLFNEDNREERLMSDDQLQRLMAVLDMDRNRTVCLVVKWLLFTGARVNEALKARWQDIDREHRTWLIQSAASKSKRRRSVPLSDAAMAVLDQLASAGKSEWLFCSSRGGRMTTINKAWQRLRVEADVPHLRLHDLRHMHASMLINSGHSLYVVQQVLGHSQPSVTARYSHLSTTTLQEAANSVGDYVNRALENTEK